MKYFFLALAAILTLSQCSKVPITGRRQMSLLPEKELIGMSKTQYREFIGENKVVATSNLKAAMVRRVGNKIAKAVESHLISLGMEKRIKGFEWEFKLVDDNTVNAWCMPGGKVVVYTGILDVAVNEAGLAVVMGHEIAHAIARHGNERMSQGMLVQGVGAVLDVATSSNSSLTRSIFLQSYGAGSTLGTLAFSRKNESEADRMGLVFMAIAGYDPQEAVGFWERMAEQAGGSTPEFMRTHPSDEKRVQQIQEYLYEAMNYYDAK
ncbi:MAG: M48 family metallopeptidase [Flavobacteriales bacterium]|nr:M48 family metallopeptidase [Flavobacteriales bacterium]